MLYYLFTSYLLLLPLLLLRARAGEAAALDVAGDLDRARLGFILLSVVSAELSLAAVLRFGATATLAAGTNSAAFAFKLVRLPSTKMLQFNVSAIALTMRYTLNTTTATAMQANALISTTSSINGVKVKLKSVPAIMVAPLLTTVK